MGNLTDLMHVLDELRACAQADTPVAYRVALTWAHEEGASNEQIEDAWRRGNTLRLQSGRFPTSFDWTGTETDVRT